MPPRTGGPYGSRSEAGRALADPGTPGATDGGSHAADGSAGAVGTGARAVGSRIRVLGLARAGVGGAWAAGIPVASTPSSALRLHVPAPAP
ncbi:hypothetical protein [Streptomyces massasporeus]|uniref:hypothetical protein n=1 Tax=Streptomyces massasporeus TaxID=67324 RepID=UPI003807B270